MYSVMSFRYGLTNGFSTLITTIATTYWAIFLTDAVGLETGVMAGILGAASIIDMVSDSILILLYGICQSKNVYIFYFQQNI